MALKIFARRETRQVLERIADALTTRARHLANNGHYIRFQPLKNRIRIWDIDGHFGHIVISVTETSIGTSHKNIIARLESIGAKKARYR